MPLFPRLRTRLALASIVIGAATAPALADDAEFRACAAAQQDATLSTTFHRCTAALVTHCGASATAAEAVACIDKAREEIETRIDGEVARVSKATGDTEDEVRWLLADARDGGASSCAMMAGQDQTAGVAVGQRAVNAAFCSLIAAGDVYALTLRLGDDQ